MFWMTTRMFFAVASRVVCSSESAIAIAAPRSADRLYLTGTLALERIQRGRVTVGCDRDYRGPSRNASELAPDLTILRPRRGTLSAATVSDRHDHRATPQHFFAQLLLTQSTFSLRPALSCSRAYGTVVIIGLALPRYASAVTDY